MIYVTLHPHSILQHKHSKRTSLHLLTAHAREHEFFVLTDISLKLSQCLHALVIVKLAPRPVQLALTTKERMT